MDKFGRNYELKVQVDTAGSVLTLKPPFTCEFDITRNTLSSLNVCQLRIFNLSQLSRDQIRYNITNLGQKRKISFKAGYGDNIATIFTGTITEAWSVREGVNFITQIECYDGGFAFQTGTITASPFIAGTPYREIIRTLMRDLPDVSIGAIGNFTGVLPKKTTYSGDPVKALQELTGGAFFIDNGKAYALKTDEYVPTLGQRLVVNAQSGLLGTPVREQTGVHFDMLFEPALTVGTKIKLESLTEQNFNGEYKVTEVKHKGVISDAVAGDAITTGGFFFSKILTPASLL